MGGRTQTHIVEGVRATGDGSQDYYGLDQLGDGQHDPKLRIKPFRLPFTIWLEATTQNVLGNNTDCSVALDANNDDSVLLTPEERTFLLRTADVLYVFIRLLDESYSFSLEYSNTETLDSFSASLLATLKRKRIRERCEPASRGRQRVNLCPRRWVDG